MKRSPRIPKPRRSIQSLKAIIAKKKQSRQSTAVEQHELMLATTWTTIRQEIRQERRAS